jgi:sRNA-binding carbon storage regulator CsrA
VASVKLGIEAIHNLDYHKNDIRKALISISNDNINVKVLKILRLNRLEFYSSTQLKRMFADAYTSVGSIETAKATDVHKYYEVQE